MVKSLNKALSIVELVAETKEELGLSELSKLSQLNITTVGRIVSTLVNRGYLYKSEPNKKYALGKRFLELSNSVIFAKSLKSIALPFLNKLSKIADETVSMISWDGRQAVRIAVINCRHLLTVAPTEGSLYDVALHATSLGKAILANMTQKWLNECYNNHTFVTYTPNTITNLSDLKRHLIIVNREGVAIGDEEMDLGVRGVAAAIKIRDGSVAGAVGIVGPSIRLTRARLAELAPAAKRCALEISKELGYKG
jgi:IclR family KDG regulon transcriptional repressor